MTEGVTPLPFSLGANKVASNLVRSVTENVKEQGINLSDYAGKINIPEIA